MPENDNKDKMSAIKDRVSSDIKKISRKRKFAIFLGIAAIIILAIIVSLLFIFNSPGPAGKNHEIEEKLDQSIQDQSTHEDKRSENSHHEEDAKKVKENNIKEDSENMNDISTLTDADGKNSFGQIFKINKIDVNLGNPIESRFLRVGVAIEYKGDKEQLNELQKRLVQLEDIIITTSSVKTRAELLTDKGKEKLRRKLLNKFNEVLNKPISNIFYTEFLVE